MGAFPYNGGWQYGEFGDVYAPAGLYVVLVVVDKVVVYSPNPIANGSIHTLMMIRTEYSLCPQPYCI